MMYFFRRMALEVLQEVEVGAGLDLEVDQEAEDHDPVEGLGEIS